MTEPITLLPLALMEGAHLAQLVKEFYDIIASSQPLDDPAIDRLTPEAYPGDPEASAAFAEGTRAELLDRREQDAATVLAALSGFLEPLAVDDDPLAPRDVVIPDADLPAWMRTLAALRLVIASRLGITDEGDHDPEDPRYGVYDWLGYRLEGLVEAAERDL